MASGKLFHNDFLPWVLGWKKQDDLGLTVVQLPKTPLMRTLNFLNIPIKVLLRNNLWDVCGMLWKKKCLTFQTILKPLPCKRSWRCGRLGPRSCLGERVGDFSSSGQETGAASKLRGPGGLSVHPEVLLGKDSISVPLWGLSTVCPSRFPAAYGNMRNISVKDCCVEATGSKGLLQWLPANTGVEATSENHSFPSNLLFLPDVFKGSSYAQYLRGVLVFWNKGDLTISYILIGH